MASVNESRRSRESQMNDVIEDARMVAYNESGEACVWYGGYAMFVYDAARDWSEVRSFVSSELSEHSGSGFEELKREIAEERMEREGFETIN